MQPFTKLTGIAAPLPMANVDTDKIDASLTDGVLRVNVAKKEPEKKPATKVIAITQGASIKDDSSAKTLKASK